MTCPRRSTRPAETVVAARGVSFAYSDGAARARRASISRSAAARSSRSRGRTAPGRRRSPRSPPACSSRTRARSSGAAGPAYLSQDPGRYLVRETVLDEVALAVGGDRRRVRGRRSTRSGSAWAAERHPRDLSSGERERLGLAAVAVAEPDLLVLDEPTRGIDPDRKAELAAWLEAYAAAGRAVLVATHDRELPGPPARRAQCCNNASASSEGARCAPRARRPLASLALRSARRRAWAALDPPAAALAALLAALAVVAARLRLARGRDGVSRPRPDARRHARRARRRRARPLRAGPERPAGDGDRRRRRRRARPAARLRGRRARRARLELLPRPGPAHAVADARVGRLRPARRAAAPLLRGPARRSRRSASCSASPSAR